MTVGVPHGVPFESAPPAVRRPRAATAPSASRGTWRDRPRWQRIALALAGVMAAAALVAGPWWGPLALSQLDFFHVRKVSFEGIRFANASELVQRLQVDTTQSVWQPLDALVIRLAGHPMVLRVDVERDLPGTLRVVVTEREPVALVQVRGSLQSADATGAVLPIDLSARPLDMPVVASADSSLLAVLDGLRQNAPELYARVIQAKRSGNDELRFSVTGGAVGAAGPAMANTISVRTLRDVTVARFKDILPVEADLARNHLRVVELDLRFRDQVIARQP